MTTVRGRKASHTKDESVDTEREFYKIIEGIKHNQVKIASFLEQRVGPGEWTITETGVKFEEDEECGTIDLVFSCSDGKKDRYILVDVSVPHLGIGQKYLLPAQAKAFQKVREVPVTRVKKAIILVRKGTETLSLQSLKIRCPIIEIQLENIVKQTKVASKAAKTNEEDSNNESEEIQEAKHERREKRDKREMKENAKSESKGSKRSAEKNNKKSEESEAQSGGFETLSDDLLYALKEAVVHESLSTSYKRVNKYIRRGLWHWIDREIMDPNVHFFLIILSSIYQSKTGDILSKRFRTIESYLESPEAVINAIFSKENALADEIKKNSERHKKALTKFLSCFSATPPFEYLKSLFLKEFRSCNDGLKARMTVYSTLEQLLARCGFEGEKEVKYPLEILDELKIFQGILCGNYETLRTDNASKKLKHLVPQIEWEPKDIYALRDQLASVLNIPAQEFNLNAFLPQAFFQDVKNMAESRKDNLRNSKNNEPTDSKRSNNEGQTQEAPVKLSRQERMKLQRQAKLERQAARQRQYDDEYMPKKHMRNENIDQPMFSEDGEQIQLENPDEEKLLHQEMGYDEVKSILDDPYAYTKPTSKKFREEEAEEVGSNESEGTEVSEEKSYVEERQTREQPRELRRSRYNDCDESRHRHFENFGGITEDDPDVIKLSLAMARHGEGQTNTEDSEYEEPKKENTQNNDEMVEEDDETFEVPTKTMVMQGFVPRQGNNHRQGFSHHQGNGNRNNMQGNGRRNNHNNMNNRSNNGNGFRRHHNQQHGNGGYRRRMR